MPRVGRKLEAMNRHGAKRFDVAIAGGGPAGAAAAILLSRQGARVALVDAGSGACRLEGAGQRLVAALKAQGLATEGLGPAAPRGAEWGEISGAPNQEHPVLRPAFDAGLRAQAADEGVEVIEATISRVRPALVGITDGADLHAGLVVEARGRRAPAPRGRHRGPATLAIGGWTGEGGSGSAIVARPSGWCWTIAGPSRSWTQATIDADAARMGLGEAWASVTDAPFPEHALVRAAELRLAAPDLDPHLPCIGDAAVAMDPLSGHGLFWALASALQCVPLVRALVDGETDLAARFYRARVIETFWRQARVGRDFHRASGLTGPYWTARAAWPDNEPSHAEPPESPHLRRQVVVREGRLAEVEALVTPQDPDGVAFVGGHAIGPILSRARGGPLPGRADFLTRVMPGTPPDEAGLIHDWLLNRGITTADLHTEVETTP